MDSSVATQFAAGGRSPVGEISRQRAIFESETFFCEVVSRLPDVVLVLNSHREVVFANRAALELVGASASDLDRGLRPGELLLCIHADACELGCGTSTFCRYCGAVGAILTSQAGRSSMEDCRVMVRRGSAEEALDLRVWATPMDLNGERFTIFVVADIADEKRRTFLERIFLHDISNTVGSLQIITHLLDSGLVKDGVRDDYIHRVERLSERLMEEINAHKILLAAESGELEARVAPLRTQDLLEEILRAFDCKDMLNGRALEIAPGSEDLILRTDATLLIRVLKNMVKNALEAAVPGDTVTMGCFAAEGGLRFEVHNPTYMPEKVRLQVFNRSFSTKGAGRGLGTYSMKYLSERYLKGRVDFTSTEAAGTTFRAWYPLT